jgi:hypothetical protein
MIITHEEIAKRAREIWQKEGCPQGRDQEHWLQAESELRQESLRHEPAKEAMAPEAAMASMPVGLKNGAEARKRPARRAR